MKEYLLGLKKTQIKDTSYSTKLLVLLHFMII